MPEWLQTFFMIVGVWFCVGIVGAAIWILVLNHFDRKR